MKWHAEWGFSALIEHENGSVLFDTGYSDVYIRNADLAGIDLDRVKLLCLSHFHLDHTRGLLNHPFSDKKQIIMHPRILDAMRRPAKKRERETYSRILQVVERDFDIVTATTPYEFAKGAWFMGEIPRLNDFEHGGFKDDPMPDDTALCFATDKGAIVVTGCSHAGICNIAQYAKQITGQPLYAIIGGFHLLEDENPPVSETIEFFKTEKVEKLLPMHCVDFPAMVEFHKAFGIEKFSAGDVIEI